jgi:hypothetical protein
VTTFDTEPVLRTRIRMRIQWGPWIRIRIRNPDPGGQKWPRKYKTVNKFLLLKCWMIVFEGKASPVAWTSLTMA